MIDRHVIIRLRIHIFDDFRTFRRPTKVTSTNYIKVMKYYFLQYNIVLNILMYLYDNGIILNYNIITYAGRCVSNRNTIYVNIYYDTYQLQLIIF